MSEQSTPAPIPEQPQVEYRDVAGFPGYRVGNDGSVWSCYKRVGSRMIGIGSPRRALSDEWHPLAPVTDRKNRPTVQLCREGRAYRRHIHRLVLEAFVGPCPQGMECCHFPDRDPSNNRLDNLQWGTPSENWADRFVHGTDFRGEKSPSAKLTQEDVRYIRTVYVPGCRRFGQGALSRKYGVDQSTISLIISGKNWSDSAAND